MKVKISKQKEKTSLILSNLKDDVSEPSTPKPRCLAVLPKNIDELVKLFEGQGDSLS